MALNDGLARFRLQQERNQAALSAIAATRTSSSSSSSSTKPSQQQPAAPTPTPRPAAKPSPPVPAARFSDDVARVDVAGNGAVAERLRDNPKVRFDGERYSCRRTHGVEGKEGLLSLITSFPDGLPASEVDGTYGVEGKEGLLSLITSFPDGLPASEVDGTYPSVLEDLQALKSSGDIFLLSVMRDMIAYPNDPRSRMEVDAELKQMFHEVKLPVDVLDIEKELQRNGEKPATDTAKRRATEHIEGRQPGSEKARKKPRGITSRTKLTNVHLPGLFDLPVDKDSKDFI